MKVFSECEVLVVEDSAVQRAALSSMLRGMGFAAILEAGNGVEAMQTLAQRETPVDLVLTDLDMPRMDGIELILQLSRLRSASYLVATSARDARLLDIVADMGLPAGGLTVLGTLPKPVRQPALEQLLQQSGAVPAAAPTACAPPAPPPFALEDLAAALERQQFVPYFQPLVDAASGKLLGVEALARWRHPALGLLPPARFLDTLEASPLLKPFTLAIVEQATAALAEWRQIGLTGLRLSLNISAAIMQDEAFIEQLHEEVLRRRIPLKQIVWEITESQALAEHAAALPMLGRLALRGYGLALDDYGSGYSSLLHLLRCPFTELKLDRGIVHGVGRHPIRRAVLESAMALGRKLNARVVAEGVEQLTDWFTLRELGCDAVQGYLVARPMPAAELPGWQRDSRTRLAALCAKLGSAAERKP